MNAQSGQALLLVLLGVVVVTVLTLSVVSRSVTDIQITTRDEESLRAFSAAEAGVEEALISNIVGSSDFDSEDTGFAGDADFETNVSPFPENASEYVYPADLDAGEIATLWLMEHDSDGSLVCGGSCFSGSTVEACWGEPGADPSALAVTVVYTTDSGEVRVARQAVDPDSARTGTNRFDAPTNGGGCTVDGQSFAYSHDIQLPTLSANVRSGGNETNGPMFVLARKLYNEDSSEPIAFRTQGAQFPSQGTSIDSTGSAGEATRRVQVQTLFPTVPSVFASALFSPNAITK